MLDALMEYCIHCQVAALYYLGMAGHFGIGNTNNLATIDVAGAFIVLLFPLQVFWFNIDDSSNFLTLFVTLISFLSGCLKPVHITFWHLNVHDHLCLPNICSS